MNLFDLQLVVSGSRSPDPKGKFTMKIISPPLVQHFCWNFHFLILHRRDMKLKFPTYVEFTMEFVYRSVRNILNDSKSQIERNVNHRNIILCEAKLIT